jgi:hypothetical protein
MSGYIIDFRHLRPYPFRPPLRKFGGHGSGDTQGRGATLVNRRFKLEILCVIEASKQYEYLSLLS